MRICAISDTHGSHRKLPPLPKGDVLIHAGDFMLSGRDPREISDFSDWFCEQPFEHIIVVAGNHDWAFEKTPHAAEHLLLGANYLRDSGITLDGISFYGSPVQPWFFDWAFNVPRGAAIKKHWDKIPEGLDILITHGPAHGILDQTHPKGEHLGCEELSLAIARTLPRIHIFGHIHGGYGEHYGDDTRSFNVAVMNEAYRVVNPPTVFEINRESI
jgi:Icc-related predicted phosphoesterase